MVVDRDQVALVTGASKGLGMALSKELVEQGWTVVGVARSKETLDGMQVALGAKTFIPCVCDVSSAADVKKVSEALRADDIIPTLFFLNAGIAGEAACESLSEFVVAKHHEIFATNYFGVLYWVEAWGPICQQRQGARFVVTGSVNAIFAPPGGSAYAASKAAISKAFEGLALTYYNTNLKFSVVYAGPIATEGLKGTLPFTWSPERMAQYMVKKANNGKSRVENSFFYSWLARLLRILPSKYTMKILGGLQ